MYEMQGPRQAGTEIPRRLPRRAGPLGQSANHTPFVLPPVQDTRWEPGCPVSLLPQNQLLSPPRLPLKVRRALQSAQSCLRTTERSEVLGAPSRLPGVSPGSPEVPSEWYPFSLVEKFYAIRGGCTRGFGDNFQDSLAVHRLSTGRADLSTDVRALVHSVRGFPPAPSTGQAHTPRRPG